MRIFALVLLAACGTHAVATPIPIDTDPCAEPQWWPNTERSDTLPFEVHYPDDIPQPRAQAVRQLVEDDWRVETEDMGFRAPLTGAPCGGDDDVDVFLWPGQPEAYADAIAEDPSTPQDDWQTILVVDPDGEYGGDILPSTIAHELNHMCQAADDWDEPIAVLEATATYVEAQIAPELGARAMTLPDFQAHPEWSVDHDDGYETWFMYGAELYFESLRHTYFDDHVDAIGDLWRRMRNTGPDNEPDWADAVRSAVAPATLEDTIVSFATARWTADPAPRVTGTLTPADTALALGPIDMLGMAFVEVQGGTPTLTVEGVPAGAEVRMVWVASDVVAIILVPTDTYDPDDRPDAVDLDLSVSWS
jgi:hypothetical protein